MVLIVWLGACGNDPGVSSVDDTGTVTSAGVAGIDPWAMVWTDVVPGFSSSQEVTLTNESDGDLLIYEIRLTSDPDQAFYIDEIDPQLLNDDNALEVVSGTPYSHVVVADLDEAHSLDAASAATLRIRTNDPACGEALVPLTAYPQGYTGTIDTTEPVNPCQ